MKTSRRAERYSFDVQSWFYFTLRKQLIKFRGGKSFYLKITTLLCVVGYKPKCYSHISDNTKKAEKCIQLEH